jgi:hypothetical protein
MTNHAVSFFVQTNFAIPAREGEAHLGQMAAVLADVALVRRAHLLAAPTIDLNSRGRVKRPHVRPEALGHRGNRLGPWPLVCAPPPGHGLLSGPRTPVRAGACEEAAGPLR